MINNELDWQAGHEKSNKAILIYMIIGLIMFSLILLLILYIIYSCKYQNTYTIYNI